MKNMNTILMLYVAQILTLGAVIVPEPNVFGMGQIATYALLTVLQVFFSAIILSAVMQHTELYRAVNGLPPVTNEYCPAEIHRMAFLLTASAIIGFAWFAVKYSFPTTTVPIFATMGGSLVTIGARFIERRFRVMTSWQLKSHSQVVDGVTTKPARR